MKTKDKQKAIYFLVLLALTVITLGLALIFKSHGLVALALGALIGSYFYAVLFDED